VIADVCDKGLGAALFMTLFRSLTRAGSSIDALTHPEASGGVPTSQRLRNALSLTNNYVARTHGKTSMFATIFFGILDTRTGILAYVNGGHVPPMVINQHGMRETLKRTGPAVGIAPDAEYSISEVAMERGETLIGYTDGLTEATNAAGEYFGEKDLIPLLAEAKPLPSLLQQVQDLVEAYSTGTQQADDITLLAVRRHES
jgi:sigma-B regulation protein RsbU (phosphoserine phosphatase)